MKIKSQKKNIFRIIIAFAVLCAVVITTVSCRTVSSADDEKFTEGGQSVSSRDRYTFLILGLDRASALTDVMILAEVDFENESVFLLQIPRDTYAEYSNSHKKLNSAMHCLGGGEALCDFLSNALCIDIDGYCAFDLDAFSEAVDAVGGVEIDIPYDMEYTDPYQGLKIKLKAGHQVLDGERAEQFVRYRAGYVRGDLDRLDAQKLFLAALFTQVSENLTPASALRLLAVMLDDINTNISFPKFISLASLAFSLEGEDISMMTLAGEDVRSGSGAWYYVISKSAAYSVFSEYMGVDASIENFDRDGVFLNSSNESFSEIYYSEKSAVPDNLCEIKRNRY